MRLDHDLARARELPFDGRFHDVSVEGHSGTKITLEGLKMALPLAVKSLTGLHS